MEGEGPALKGADQYGQTLGHVEGRALLGLRPARGSALRVTKDPTVRGLVASKTRGWNPVTGPGAYDH
jgi:hypothetical protein